MRKINLLFLSLVTLAGVVVSTPASAQFLLGVQLGRAKAEGLCRGVPAGVNVSCSEIDNNVPRGFVGYQFTRNWGVEAGVAGGTVGAPGNQTIKARLYDVTLVGTLPISSMFDVYGKAGLYHASVKESDQVFNGVVTQAGRSAKNSDLTVGAGVQFNATKNISLRAELGFFPDVGDGAMGTRDITAVSVAALWRFQ